MEKEKKNLTLKYVFTQFTYWMAGTGATCFATTYLLSKGISPSAVGILVAATGLLSCVTQPLLASAADKAGPSTLNKILPVMSCEMPNSAKPSFMSG